MNVQVDGPSTVALTQTKALVPGYLLTPFGWAAKPLAAIIQSDPALLRHIFELDRPRMHVIALAFWPISMIILRHTLRRSCFVVRLAKFCNASPARLTSDSKGCYAACRPPC